MTHRIPRRLRAGWTVKRLFASAARHSQSNQQPLSDDSSSFFSPKASISFPDDAWEDDGPVSAYSQVFDISHTDTDPESSFSSDSNDTSSLDSESEPRASSDSIVSSSTSLSSSSSTPFRPLPPIPISLPCPQSRPFRALPIPPHNTPRSGRFVALRLETSTLPFNRSGGCDSPTIPQTAIVPSRDVVRVMSTAANRDDRGEIDWDLLEQLLGARDA